MSYRIHQLPPEIANQIAAGEVVERPASVVKELLENSTDASADAIHIEVDFGGLNRIKVSDNGCGILAEDLPLAVMAHATSKITKLEDLYAITSMGFRGEALASIASVSRLDLYSRPALQPHAMHLQVENSIINIMPCARAPGTTVEVLDLFFNAPVRKKFLKTERHEFLAIEQVAKRFALGNPHIALTLKHNDKQIFALAAAACENTKLLRIKKLLGKGFLENAIYINVKQGQFSLEGWVSNPNLQRSQNDKQWFYINQRMVRDKLIQHAIRQAYEEILHPGRFPVCVLYLALPAEQVDVNVHPTKHEVRFQQPRAVHDFITTELKRVLIPEEKIAVNHFIKPPVANKFTELREPHADFSISPIGKDNTSVWLPLNDEFTLIFIKDVPFLVDIKQLQYQQKLAFLMEAGFPLPHRPLLVPIIIALQPAQVKAVAIQQQALLKVGIQFDFVSDVQIAIRSIPKCLPHLDIKQVFLNLSEQRLDARDDWLKFLVQCQAFHAEQLSLDEKDELYAHLASFPEKNTSFYLQLTRENCRLLLSKAIIGK
ncbi:DNA mismatch repair endonuclease MutL [Legionella septentrionalis]|uniref:DNA mismatch repair endonuclease MutL n=1 Tax=Legionella septentrionalis TaxID=2498109 RepID=UPI0013154304|nr:DNA mismatch repair endonuclease MutL [Legionella septentrionalis]